MAAESVGPAEYSMNTTRKAGEPYASAAQEDRSAPRKRISIPASLRPSGSKSVQTVLRDISLSGFSAMSIKRLNPDTIVWLTLPGLESLQARVIWWNNNIVGCAFDQLMSPIIFENLIARWYDTTTYHPK